MDEKRVALNLRVHPWIRRKIEAFAAREKRSTNNLAEILLEWSVPQLERAGSTLALMDPSPGALDSETALTINREPDDEPRRRRNKR